MEMEKEDILAWLLHCKWQRFLRDASSSDLYWRVLSPPFLPICQRKGKKPHISEGSLQELATKEYGILFQGLAVWLQGWPNLLCWASKDLIMAIERRLYMHNTWDSVVWPMNLILRHLKLEMDTCKKTIQGNGGCAKCSIPVPLTSYCWCWLCPNLVLDVSSQQVRNHILSSLIPH